MNADQNDPPEYNPSQNDPFQNKSTKKGKGRQKINIAKIENENNLQVTFSKRRAGLFKKASELTTLTGAEILVLVFSPSGKAHLFAHPDMETISNKFLGRNQNQNQRNIETDLYLIAQRNNNIIERNQELVEMENQLELEKKKAKELEMDNLDTLRQGHWSAPCIFELSDKDAADFTEKFGNFKVRMDDLLRNRGPSLVNPHTNMYPEPNIYQNIYTYDQMNPAIGTGTDGINFPWPNQIGTSYFGLPSHNYDIPGPSDLSYHGNQEGSIFLSGLDTPILFNNITGNLNGSNLMNIPGPSGINNLIDIPPGPSETNLMNPIFDPIQEQVSTFTFNPESRSISSTITIPDNPNIGNAAPYVLQSGNSMVPLMQENLENMSRGMFNNNYNGDGNYMTLNQGNVQNMFQGTFNNIDSGNYTVPNQGNIQNMFQGTFNNNNTGIYTTPNLQGNIQNMFQGTFNNNNTGIYTTPNLQGNIQNMFQGTFNNNNNGNGNFTVPYQGNVQNMFQRLNNNNNGYGNSTASGQNNDIQNMLQEFNRNNGQGN